MRSGAPDAQGHIRDSRFESRCAAREDTVGQYLWITHSETRQYKTGTSFCLAFRVRPERDETEKSI